MENEAALAPTGVIMDPNIPKEDVIKLMVATDSHLGFMENDPVRGEDSFIAFEEVLAAAREAEVDALLLAGDLFHAARPSPACLLRATRLLREYALGNRPVALELLSDPLEAFGRSINYEDPDLNVACPVFSIHGNHDDPVGQGAVSSLDILANMGLVNYFGRWKDYTLVRLAPVLLRKGATNLALYGMGHLKDQRLSRLFKEGKVEMEQPENGDDWFNLLLFHQNRADRGAGNYIQEDVLPGFLDLIVWGHEHDCRVIEEENHNRKFFVTQPGSSVATSLAAGEAIPKHCALLQIYKKKFMLTPIPLKTVRPFIFKTIVLSEEELGEDSVNENEKVQGFLKNKVHEAIEEARILRSGHPKQPELPLIRLSVFYERESQDFNRMRFSQNFSGAVANPDDVLIMKREKRIRERREQVNGDVDMVVPAVPAAECADVEHLIEEYFLAMPEERRPTVLSVRAMTDAIRDFTLKRDEETFRRVVDAHRLRCLKLLAANAPDEPELPSLPERMLAARVPLDSAEPERRRAMLDEHRNKADAAVAMLGPQPVVVLDLLDSDDDDKPIRGGRKTGGARGRGSRGGRPRGRPAAAPRSPPPPQESPPTRRNAPRRSAANKSAASWMQNYIADRVKHEIDDSD